MVVALAIQVATNYANDYSDGKRGTDDPGSRVGPVRLVGWGLKPAGGGEAGRDPVLRRRRGGRPGPRRRRRLGAARGRRRELRRRLALHRRPEALRLPRPRRGVRVHLLRPGRHRRARRTCSSRTCRAWPSRPPCRSASWPRPCWWSTTCATSRATPRSGKRTLAVRLGDRRTRFLYVGLLVGAYVALPFVAGLGGRPAGALGLRRRSSSPRSRCCAVLQGARGADLIPVLEATGRVQLAYGALLATGLALAA